MHIHKTTRTSATTEADVAKLNLSYKCESCTREFTKLRSQRMYMVRLGPFKCYVTPMGVGGVRFSSKSVTKV